MLSLAARRFIVRCRVVLLRRICTIVTLKCLSQLFLSNRLCVRAGGLTGVFRSQALLDTAEISMPRHVTFDWRLLLALLISF
jgi:hypothetical protein